MDLPDMLRPALADCSAKEREPGQGGMVTVYLAEDLKHHRKVALEVPRPLLVRPRPASLHPLLAGELPPRVLGLVAEWAALHKAELEEDWRLAEAREILRPIPPLE